MSKWLSILATVCAIMCVAAIFVVSFMPIGLSISSPKDLIPYIQIIVTFFSTLVIAFSGFAASRSNEEYKGRIARESAEALARLQSDLSIKTSTAVEEIKTQFTKSINQSTEQLRHELGRASEEFKIRLAQTVPQRYSGYHALFRASSKYFFALRRLEEGIYPAEDLKSASSSADEAIGLALLVDDDDRNQFFSFITEAHFIAETAKVSNDPEKYAEMWFQEGKRIGEMYKSIERNYSAKVRS